MNQNIKKLKPYPFQKLSKLLKYAKTNDSKKLIDLSIGEPKHKLPKFVAESIIQNINKISKYPTTIGLSELRIAIKKWLKNRHLLNNIHEDSHILPVNGSREALFAITQVIVDKSKDKHPFVLIPNPLYQIYEGATILSGAIPKYINLLDINDFKYNLSLLKKNDLKKIQLFFVCSPGNPAGKVIEIEEWKEIFLLSDKYNFVVASDECYSEIYFDEKSPTLGALRASEILGRKNYKNLVMFTSLSKRSNIPGLRSGFVAGDPKIISNFLNYRTYHGSAMNPNTQIASALAWSDEAHVVKNRRLYKKKFNIFKKILSVQCEVKIPDGGFYVWLKTPTNSKNFALNLFEDYNVKVLPGDFISRVANGINPGSNYVRIALVSSVKECEEAAHRIKKFITNIKKNKNG